MLKSDTRYAFRIKSETEFEYVLKLIQSYFPNLDLDSAYNCVDKYFDQWLYFECVFNFETYALFGWDGSNVNPTAEYKNYIIINFKKILREYKLKRINDELYNKNR